MKRIKRPVSVGLWDDNKIINTFTPEDKYFMLYLLTNPGTTQLGIYELNFKKAAFDLGWSADSVDVIMDRFEKVHKIIKFSKSTSEVAVINFLRHSIIKGGKPVEDCLEKEIKSVKNKSLINYVFNIIVNYSDLNETVRKVVTKYLNNNENNNDNDNDNENEDTSTYRPRIVNEQCLSDSEPKEPKPLKVYFENVGLNKKYNDYLKSRKSKLKEVSIQANKERLMRLANNDVEIAKQICTQSIENGYLGLFELKNETYNKQTESQSVGFMDS